MSGVLEGRQHLLLLGSDEPHARVGLRLGRSIPVFCLSAHPRRLSFIAVRRSQMQFVFAKGRGQNHDTQERFVEIKFFFRMICLSFFIDQSVARNP